ncbi:unnamed protein product [Euphydryas editha]|uniref:Uncharacterized protein n=1 Tax=Euphydryas editha TaxID=104508 RepID=A0AAU9VG52_EUPED|nr:unnamed protein product [Euphydryas editha]
MNTDYRRHEIYITTNDNPERFFKVLSRSKIFNFASDCIKKSQKNKDGSKQVLLKMERDIFGRLLAIGIKKDIDIEYCLSYPLAPAPPALFQCSGEMFKSVKSTLADYLKSQIILTHPTQIDMEVIDGFYFLYLVGNSMPQTFGQIAQSILIKLCATSAREIHIIFDRYLTPSIKHCERKNREEINIPYTIHGPLQPRPTNFSESLKNFHFKEALVKFLADFWENDYFSLTLLNKVVFITVGEECFSYRVEGDHVIKTKETNLSCQHEEADTRIMYHISKAPAETKVLVKANDTDVLIILLGNIHKVADMEIWLAGTKSKKTKKDVSCINCTQLAAKLGPTVCRALPAFHAFTGCDYSAAFYNKGKVRPFKIFLPNNNFQTVFASLTNISDIFNDQKMSVVQEFTALMYGVKKCTSVNKARYHIFQKKYSAMKIKENFLKKVTSFDSKLIPPCWKSLKQKILRTIFINCMWQNATEPRCVKFNPEEYGWSVIDGNFKPTWFIGDPTPMTVEEILN